MRIKPRSPSALFGDAERRQRERGLYYAAQSGCCYLCGGVMILRSDNPYDPDYATFDHVEPRFRSGVNGHFNFLLAHRRCNEAKGCAEPQQEWCAYARIVQKRVQWIRRLGSAA